MATVSKLLIFFLLLCIGSSWNLPANAARLRCADIPVIFEYENTEGLRCVCDTARAAISFLKQLGLETTDPVTIRIVDHIPLWQKNKLIGCYDTTTRKVDLLTYSKVLKGPQGSNAVMGIAMSEDLWCSYAAHELAHVISSQYIGSEIKTHIAGEYISAVTQLAVLPPESLEKVLTKHQNIAAYKSMTEMSELYFLFAPNAFAVKCYLHFMSLENPKVFIKQLVVNENWSWDGY